MEEEGRKTKEKQKVGYKGTQVVLVWRREGQRGLGLLLALSRYNMYDVPFYMRKTPWIS